MQGWCGAGPRFCDKATCQAQCGGVKPPSDAKTASAKEGGTATASCGAGQVIAEVSAVLYGNAAAKCQAAGADRCVCHWGGCSCGAGRSLLPGKLAAPAPAVQLQTPAALARLLCRVVGKLCLQQQSCEVAATDRTFGGDSPCKRGVKKALTFNYK